MIAVGTQVIIKEEAWIRVYGDKKTRRCSRQYDASPRPVAFIGESTRAGMYMLESPWFWWLEGDLIPVVAEKKRRTKNVEEQ